MPRSDSFNGESPSLSLHAADSGLDDLLPDQVTDESEALAELFLGDASHTAPSPATPPRRPTHSNGHARETGRLTAPPIEGLVLGHLPVLASAWVQQYARHMAAELRGPVALLRLRSSEATLELVSGSGIIHQPHEPAPASLSQALASAAREALALLVRTDETTEPRLAELTGLDTLTLLSGADEAATVASYRTIKNLTSRMDEDASQPAIRLAIMGATSGQAADASARIERATSAFLDRQVCVTACISKIGGGKSTLLFKGPVHEPVEATLRGLRQSFIPPVPRSSPPSTPVRPPTHHAAPATPRTPPTPRTPDSVVSRIGHLAAASPAPSLPLPRLSDQIPGLSPVPFTCPYAPQVELAFDAHGRVHILGHLDDPARAITPLLVTADWARAHDPLLRQAGPSLTHGDSAPVIHAFTADPASTRHLSHGALRLHLLAQVRAGGQSVWFSTPLN